MKFQFKTLFLLSTLNLVAVDGFAARSILHRCKCSRSSSSLQAAYTNNNDSSKNNFLLEEFATASGEIINPYKILKVSRTAERTEIRQRYKDLSRKYHPDGARYRDILPGSCDNEDDIREEWERIKLSYEILSDKKLRLRYDRNSVIADPGAAVGRAALGAVGGVLEGMSKGLFMVGSAALNQMSSSSKNDEK